MLRALSALKDNSSNKNTRKRCFLIKGASLAPLQGGIFFPRNLLTRHHHAEFEAPVRSVADAAAYRDRIIAAIPVGNPFEPLMTLYLADNTSPEEIVAAKASQFIKAVKYYPAGATTNSGLGVTDIRRCDRVLEVMQQIDMPLLLHGEVTDGDIDVFDRKKMFIENHLIPFIIRFPKLRVVLEHITTSDAVEFVLSANNTVAATITPQHLLFSRNILFEGGIFPHFYCLPIFETRGASLGIFASGNIWQFQVFSGYR